MRPLSYANSQHNDVAPEQAQPEQRTAPAEQPGDSVLDYPEMNKSPVQVSDDITPELRELREERKLFNAQGTYKFDIADHPADTDAERAMRVEMREQAADLDLTSGEVTQLRTIANSELREGIPSDDTVAAWGRQSIEDLRRQYGEAGATQRLAEARALVARDPKLRAVLDRSGLGSHPDVVRLLVSKARSQIASGKLKVRK